MDFRESICHETHDERQERALTDVMQQLILFFIFTKQEPSLTDSVDRVFETNKLYSLLFSIEKKNDRCVYLLNRIGGDLTTLREHGNSC